MVPVPDVTGLDKLITTFLPLSLLRYISVSVLVKPVVSVHPGNDLI